MKGRVGSATQFVTPSTYWKHGITGGKDWIEQLAALSSVDLINDDMSRVVINSILESFVKDSHRIIGSNDANGVKTVVIRVFHKEITTKLKGWQPGGGAYAKMYVAMNRYLKRDAEIDAKCEEIAKLPYKKISSVVTSTKIKTVTRPNSGKITVE